MRIILITPTWTDDLGIFSRIAKKRNSQPPLGILYLATAAEQLGHTVRAVDADVEDHTIDSLEKEIIEGEYDLVGISATSPIFHKAVTLAQRLKDRQCRAPVVIGGEHLNIFRKDAFHDAFDYAFYGESDFTFAAFLKIIAEGSRDFSSMRGFIYRKEGEVIETPPAERINDLDRLPFPAMHVLKFDRYVMTFAKFKQRRYLPILMTRGCPFKCAFCSEPLTNPHVRFRSAANVVDEMEKWASELGITHFFFMDSNLTLKRALAEGLCHEILRRNLKITFEGWTRANLVDKPLLALLKSAGLIRMSYGIESGDPEILKIIHKEVSQDDMRKAFAITDELGIEPACSVMLGLPGETRESVNRTIAFVRSIPQIRYANFSIANPYPGTEIYGWAQTGKHGMHLEISDFSQYRRYDYSPISVNDLTQKDLVRLQKIGLLQMHLSPRRIWAAIGMLGLGQLIPVAVSLIGALLASPFRRRPAEQASSGAK